MSSSLESILTESRVFPAPSAFAAQANLSAEAYQALQQQAAHDPAGFWGDLARREIDWHKPFSQVLDDSQAPFYQWFADGTLNLSVNCLDRHLNGPTRHKAAIIWEGERGEQVTLTYAQLHREVCRCANVMTSLGVGLGERVAIYMPMTPEAAIAMLACARIGAIHSVVFGGFSAEALKDRIEDTQAKLLITADGALRAGKIVPLKANADQALANSRHVVSQVLVLKRTGETVPMQAGRDIWWHDAMQGASAVHAAPAHPAEQPLFILYTSGSTGKPKGIVHSSGGYLLWAILTMRWVFDIKPTDVYWCTADIGWITGHTYVVYGPLAVGATLLMYEGAPTYPDAGRLWSMIEKHGVSIFYTAPTAIRALMKLGDSWPDRYDLSSLRLLGTVGEPINPEAWIWYQQTIGKRRCPIVDTWWQTETGGHIISPIPGVTALKPGSCTQPLPGIFTAIVDEQGQILKDPGQGGYLVITKPWPSMLRGVWGDPARYVKTYWAQFDNRYYVAGDSAHRDADGAYWIMGRVDDVLNVSGHRLGTMEVESALVSHPAVAEAAVVGKPHDIKGEAICAFVVLRQSHQHSDPATLVEALRQHVSEAIGAIAKPDDIRFTDNLPKTRSGKIMRRLLRAIARGETITQDISTLENAESVRQLGESR